MVAESNSSISSTCAPNDRLRPISAKRRFATARVSGVIKASDLDGAITRR
jgi:hypothetical protein